MLCGRTLEFLDIDGNDIGPSNVKDLADAIRVNNSLLTLKLARNKVNDVGAWDLAEALKVNRTLTVLDLTRKYDGVIARRPLRGSSPTRLVDTICTHAAFLAFKMHVCRLIPQKIYFLFLFTRQ
jgi:hypothetical protein